MKQNAYIADVAMTPFGKHLDRSLKSLASEAVLGALKDAGLDKSVLEAAWVGNVGAGVISGQVCVPGQVVLRDMGIGTIPGGFGMSPMISIEDSNISWRAPTSPNILDISAPIGVLSENDNASLCSCKNISARMS